MAGAGCGAGAGGRGACSPPPEAVEAVAADWMLEFACSCLCRRFGTGCAAEFRRWRDVAQALINGLSTIPAHQKKRVYLCQLLIRIEKGKNLECHFENDQRISPLESALSSWTLLEREEIKLEKLHEEIRRLIQIQVVAVPMEQGYFREAAEALDRLFTGSDSDKPLRVKLATIVKGKDPYVPLLQSFSYNLLVNKVKAYIELFMKENETNFLTQAATEKVESEGLGATALQNTAVNVNDCDKRNLETKQRRAPPATITSETYDESLDQKNLWKQFLDCEEGLIQDGKPEWAVFFRVWTACKMWKRMERLWCVAEDDSHYKIVVSPSCFTVKRWTYKEDLELKSGVREFGVGNWAKILVHGDFNNRTSVMLKDRWRTLCRIEQG